MRLPDNTYSPDLQPEPSSFAEHILSVLSDGVIAVDQDSNITFINEAASGLIGWNQHEVIGQPLASVFRLHSTLQQLDAEFLHRLLYRQISIGPITKQQLITKQDTTLLIDYSISPLSKESAVLMFHDISHVQDMNRTLLYQVSYDPLTRLPNRDAIQQTLNQLHNKLASIDGTYSILLCDLDRFKLINDGYGHAVGDEILKILSKKMLQTIRPQDNLGRWGGEEFICLLPNSDIHAAVDIAERLRKSIANATLNVDQRAINTTTSIGIGNYPHDGSSLEEVLRVSDAMLYEAKRTGRNRVRSSLKESGNILSIATQLDEAISDHRIVPAYQPIVDLQSGKRVAEEALARIVTKQGELIEAAHFIEAAVHLQMAHKIDYEITRQTVAHCSHNVLSGKEPIPHFVNISANLLLHPPMVNEILETAKQECIACGDKIGNCKPLVIEITEQELLQDVQKAKRILAPFLDFGLRLAIDDFGSGYTSFHYLADLPVSFLKIEGSLVRRVAQEKRVRSILQGIQNIADDLELITIAEYVEDEATLNVLRDLGVEWGQGYYFGKPALADHS